METLMETLDFLRRMEELETRLDILRAFYENERFVSEETVCLILGFDDIYKTLKKHNEEVVKGYIAANV